MSRAVALLATFVLGAALLTLLDPGHAQSPPQGLWDIPAAAWHRPLGDHPLGATGKNPPSGLEPAQSRTKRGIPVGGIGTGSFMYNLAGSFGPWEFDIGGDDSRGGDWRVEANRGHEERFLSQAAFHVYERSAGTLAVKTLATEDVLPAWPRMDVGEGDYYALFPKAWFTYDDLPAPLAMKQFSPFVAGDYRTSSLPVGTFQFAATNPTNEPIDIAVMLTFPNAIYRRPTADYVYPRRGKSSSVETSAGVTGVRLQAEHPANVPETQRTEWVIAAQDPGDASVSYTQDWAADGDGRDVMADFEDDGVLSNQPLDPRGKGLAGAVAVKVTLPPGERAVMPFAVAWDFPIVQFENTTTGTQWWKRYKEWFPGRYRGWDIAREALQSKEAWEAGIDEWWGPIAHGEAYPLWLRRAALNELYYDIFGGVFWEAGCITKPKKFGGRKDQNLYFTLEANVYQDAESLGVRHWETRHLLTLFPDIERDVLLAWADFIMDDPKGRAPHDAGTPSNDPYFVYGQYFRTARGEQPPTMEWSGLPSRFVQQAHAYWKQTGDTGFLREVFPAARRTMAYLARKDNDGDGLPEGGSGAEGPAFTGEATHVSALYVGALEAMAEMAGKLERPSLHTHYLSAAARARRRLEATLWSKRLGHYRFAVGGPNRNALFLSSLNAQRYAEVNGLPPVVRWGRIVKHNEQIYERLVLPFGEGAIGAVNAVNEKGVPLADRQAREVWPGSTYFAAASMYRAAEVTNRSDLKDAALAMAKGAYDVTYENDATAYWFDTPEAWMASDITRYRAQQYQRPRAVWELLLEIDNPFS